MPGVFISYRRGPVASIAAGRLYDRLADELGELNVFMDVDTIEPGDDFAVALDSAVAACDALIVVVEPGWADATDSEGRRRLDDPADYVRLEIAAALRRKVRVIPVLLEGASMPRRDQLPTALEPLTRRQAATLTNERWATDFVPLMNAVRQEVVDSGSKPPLRPDAHREQAAHSSAVPPAAAGNHVGRQSESTGAQGLGVAGSPRRMLPLVIAVAGVAGVIVVIMVAAIALDWGGSEAADDAGAPTVGPEVVASTTLPATHAPEVRQEPSTTIVPVEVLTFEAEDGSIEPPMSVRSDIDASNGGFVTSGVPEQGTVTIGPFVVDGGEYAIEACGAARGARATASDSMYVLVDDEPIRYVWDFFEDQAAKPTDWSCEALSARCDGTFDLHGCKPLILSLESGSHTLAFMAREPDFALDTVTIRSTPSG